MMEAKTDIIADMMRTDILPPATDAIPAAEIKKCRMEMDNSFIARIDLAFPVSFHTTSFLHVVYDHSLELLIRAFRATAIC